MNATPQDSDARPLSFWCAIESCAGLTRSDRRNYWVFCAWIAMWILSFPAASWLLKQDFASQKVFAIVIAAFPFVLALLSLRAYAHFFRSVDELTQKIQVEGLKLGLGLGVLYLSARLLFDQLGAEPLVFYRVLIWIMVGYAIGQSRAARRYR